MELKPIEKLQPFRHFCMSIGELPSSYMESMTYVELLMWLCKYLSETVIPTINNNAQAVEELQALYIQLHDYVENYFDNLDVQEEINHKLDEMVEDGTLEQIMIPYFNQKPYYFNSVAEMKAYDLKVGDMAITLGYYSANDGGGANYFIRNKTNNDTEDNGSIHFISESLVAELIIVDGKINIKQYGAKGNGIDDDTNAFINAINFIKSKFVYNDMSKSFLLYLTEGNYLISQTLEIPFYVKIKFDGNILILSNVVDDSTIRYISDGFITPSSALDNINQAQYRDGKLISGNGILMIQRNNGRIDGNSLTSTSIGIEIGDTSVIQGALQCAGIDIENVSIRNFAIGVKLNSINTYLIRFNSLSIGRCRVNLQYGDSNGVIHNSGENIVFTNCGFSHSYNAFINYAGGQLSFIGCSFDFNGNAILLKHASHITLDHCHFESVRFHQTNYTDSCSGTAGTRPPRIRWTDSPR